VVSPELLIPPDLDRAGVEHYRQRVEGLLNRLTCEAEAWAAAGTPKVNESPVQRVPAWRRLHPDPAPAPHPAQQGLAAASRLASS
jgi:hypothetical protein